MYGYNGKILIINLTDKSYEVRDLDPQMARDYLGGPALGARIMYDEMPANTPWDAPESVIGFVRGPLNASPAFFGGRWTVVSKSPVYDGWNDANCGGFFGVALTQTGYDAVFVKGISEAPVYVVINNGEIEFKNAAHIWGKTTIETEDIIREELGDPHYELAMIAPGGENCSYMAAVMNDAHRAAGRGGSGAVMGSKKLKALAVKGSHKIECADPQKLYQMGRTTAEAMKGEKAPIMANRGRYGTAGGATGNILINASSIKNWAGSSVDDFPENKANIVKADQLDNGRRVKKYACAACPLGCGALYEFDDERYPDMRHIGRPEYETITGFTSMVMCEDVNAMIICNHLCNEYGLDTIAVSGTVAWAMEEYVKGNITKEDLDGEDLCWGNADAVINVTRRICKGEGNTAKLLLNGSQFAANTINKGFEALFCASGIELAQHDPRLSTGLGRIYQYDPTPGRHVKGGRGLPLKLAAPEIKYDTRMTGFDDVYQMGKREIDNASGYCMSYPFLQPKNWVQPAVEAVTGFKYTKAEWWLLGMRMYIMRLSFAARDGKRRRDYTISPRCIAEPLIKNGPLAGVEIDIETYADNFMDVLGCTKDYMPRPEMLEILGMDFLINDLYPPQEA